VSYTLAQQLDYVQTAIRNVESGIQETTDEAGNRIVYPSLEVLYQREERLLGLISDSSAMEQRIAEF